jgi:hypothetical protein
VTFASHSTIAPEIGVFFSTAFHYANPGPPPSNPILHLLGNSLTTGAIVYDQVVANPFCEILWLPSAGKRSGGAPQTPPQTQVAPPSGPGPEAGRSPPGQAQ